ncbi:MAG: hypothetical protein A3C62_01015 [Candidatus Zambryskibacteria bacterium RIFCSPHIGHO2_02_FULL_39_16]|nr:MAG: hypothetical protein A3C62_01015 [Candidatus Zambryskibacteria bacterium RIFCSPHIGHO2_02_FULL_39_16]
MINKSSYNDGYLLIQVLVFGAVAVIIISGLVAFAAANIKLGRRIVLSEQAFQMAEAGLEYYRWHLAHDPSDYTDGTGQPGPYVKNFYDKDGILLGTFSLDIIPPPLGSTLVTLQSTGISAQDTSVQRTIISKLAIPSFANFAAVANAVMRFGSGTEVFGPIHSNNGIRFDGIAHNLVTSLLSNYNDPIHSGANEFAVHTHVNPPPGTGLNNSFRPLEAPPTSPVMSRTDVFIAGRSFPAPEVEFDTIMNDLIQMKADAESGGLYFASSTVSGYQITLKTDDTFDLFRVNNLRAVPSGCTSGTSGWGSWTASSTTLTLLGNYPFPANGLIFLDDNVWVEGTIDGARLTIVAARIPDDDVNQRRSMTFNNNILYTNYDGTDVIALIGQNNVNAGLYSEDNLRIDAALVAQNGRVGRFSYGDTDCAPYNRRNTLTLYGTIVTALQYGFAYGDPVTNGYSFRNLIYDSFLLYNPPPFFPETEDFHEVIYWKEI